MRFYYQQAEYHGPGLTGWADDDTPRSKMQTVWEPLKKQAKVSSSWEGKENNYMYGAP